MNQELDKALEELNLLKEVLKEYLSYSSTDSVQPLRTKLRVKLKTLVGLPVDPNKP